MILSNFLSAKKILTAVMQEPIPATKNTAAARYAKISGKAAIITAKPINNSPTINIPAARLFDA